MPLRALLRSALPAAAVAALSLALTSRLLHHTAPAPADPPAAAPPPAPPLAFLQQWCFECHGDGAAKGHLSLDDLPALSDSQWDKIQRHVLLHTMPPQGQPAPLPAARDQFAHSLLAWQASLPTPASLPPFRRLTRREFAQSLEDLLGLAPPLGDLPEEESAHGFDNSADFQPLPPAALERYLAAIRATVRTALLPAPLPATLRRFMPQDFTGAGLPSPDAPSFRETETADPITLPVTLQSAGTYRFSLRAYAHQAGDAPVQVALLQAPPQPLHSTQRSQTETLSATADLPAGPSLLSFHLANPWQDPLHPDPHRRTRRLLLQEASLEGPLSGDATPSAPFIARFGPPPPPSASWDQRLQWAEHALLPWARRAWRRPPSPEESTRLLQLLGQALAHGLRSDEALALAAQAALASPHFLFLPNPTQASPPDQPYALAARLSYLLWSTLPDPALLDEARSPWTPTRLASSALRLLQDPRAHAFARDFAGQWLQLRNTTLSRPDPDLFPQASPAIRQALQRSAETFFLHLVRQNEPLHRLLDADYTFLNPALAHWLQPPASADKSDPADPTASFQKSPLADPARFGLLGHPAVLLLTSPPNRTSPVLRGKYILETLLGLEPPPPPPNIPSLPSAHPAPANLRAALQQHRANPTCAACHRAIDPLGFPLEAFDPIGRPRPTPPEALASTTFTDFPLRHPPDLVSWLTHQQGPRFANHVAERLLTYALGRGLRPAERLAAHALVTQLGGPNAGFRDLLLATLTSPAFLPPSEPPSR